MPYSCLGRLWRQGLENVWNAYLDGMGAVQDHWRHSRKVSVGACQEKHPASPPGVLKSLSKFEGVDFWNWDDGRVKRDSIRLLENGFNWMLLSVSKRQKSLPTELPISGGFWAPYWYFWRECICSCSQACHMLCAVVSCVGVPVCIFILYLRQRRSFLGSISKTMASSFISIAECWASWCPPKDGDFPS